MENFLYKYLYTVTSLDYIFSSCRTIKSIEASSFNITKVETMKNLFSYCDELISVNLSSFDTSNVKNIQGMFYLC